MPQWIHILDYDAEEGSIALLLFNLRYLELVHKSFPFMRFGRAGLPATGPSGFLAWKWKNLTATRLALVSPIHIHIEG